MRRLSGANDGEGVRTPRREAISIADTARLLDVHYDTVRRLIKHGELQAFRVGRAIRIHRAALVRYVKTREIGRG